MAKKITKTLLKEVAKEYASAILNHAIANDHHFDEECLLSEEDQEYVVDQLQKIADRLNEEPLYDFNEILKRHLEIL